MRENFHVHSSRSTFHNHIAKLSPSNTKFNSKHPGRELTDYAKVFPPFFGGLLRCKSGKSVLVGMSIDRNERVFRRGKLNENVTVEKNFLEI